MNACGVHKIHLPRVSMPDVHHVWPRGDGGPDIPENKVVICPTGHRNVHEMLDALRAHKGLLTSAQLRPFSKGEQQLAMLGWDRSQRKAM